MTAPNTSSWGPDLIRDAAKATATGWGASPEIAEHIGDDVVTSLRLVVEGEGVGEPCTDMGNSRRFARALKGRVLYCDAMGGWYCWDGKRFRLDETGEIERHIRHTVREIAAEAAAAPSDTKTNELLKWAIRSQDAARLAAIE